jgi:dihydrofolate reductase
VTTTRRIVAWTSLTLDGYTSGPNGPAGDTWLHEHAGHPATAEYFEGIWRGADTILLGRTNYEGFHAVWPAITRDERTDPRTRDLGRWLDATEKVVVSRTLTDARWENSRITRDLAAEVERLRVALVPVLVGGRLRLFPDGVAARFHTAGVTALEHVAVGLHLRRP